MILLAKSNKGLHYHEEPSEWQGDGVSSSGEKHVRTGEQLNVEEKQGRETSFLG